MKEMFETLMSINGDVKVEKCEGEYDSQYGVYYDKTKDGWRVTDKYTGRAIATKKSTKKECQASMKAVINQLNEKRNEEKYLQAVINFNELKDELVSNEFPF